MNKWTTQEMAQRLARDIEPGWYVNIGIGMPEMVCENLREDDDIILQSENGILGMGPLARGDDIDTDLVNAGKKPVTARLGASYFEHTTSFAMMRGGHLDLCILGAFQVSGSGDLANWSLGRPGIPPAVGGAMDLAVGAKRLDNSKSFSKAMVCLARSSESQKKLLKVYEKLLTQSAAA